MNSAGVVVGGISPDADLLRRRAIGIAGVFQPGTPMRDIGASSAIPIGGSRPDPVGSSRQYASKSLSTFDFLESCRYALV